jgi:hypothetical protein
MRSLPFILALILITPSLKAQEKVFDDPGVSGYGGPVTRFTTVDGEWGLMFGSFSGAKIGDHWIVGGGGYSLISSFDTTQDISMGYGGMGVGYTSLIGRSGIFYTATLLLGGGAARSAGSTSGIFVAEGDLIAGLELLPFFRLGIGGGYRFAAGGDLPGHPRGSLNGADVGFYVIFGKFY